MHISILSKFFLLLLIISMLLAACTATPTEQAMLQVNVVVGDQTHQVQVSPGEAVKAALDVAEISLGSMDRVEPDLYVPLTDGMEINITRMYEEFEVEQVVIPYEQQLQPSEFLPEGETQPLQLGENGLQEITYRIVYENGVEISKTEIKVAAIKDPLPQIMLVGVPSSFAPVSIPGRLVYLSDNNAWMMEATTANRISIVSTRDLDGRVFDLSDDGQWLLFTRSDNDDDVINTLWAINIDDPEIEVDLGVENVIHFASWKPGSTEWFAFSTVEQRQASPGWQANNELQLNIFSDAGWVDPSPEIIVETNSGGVYGWWGTDFVYAPNSLYMAYASPNQVGILEMEEGSRTPAVEMPPLKTRSDWAWVPGMGWGPSGLLLYTVRHAPPPGITDPEASPVFNLIAIPLTGGKSVDLVSSVGMFAYPLPSPLQPTPKGEPAYQVAYLQAIFPEQSEKRSYRLMVMDRDGSNKQELFPPAGTQGIEPQRDWGHWSPQPLEETGEYALALLYQGNIWLIDTETGQAWQVTGDGRINRLDWR
ncbi:MAG: G5 domain-containing protein [Chloroflexota bacterium]|nr:G5 domain-containing protein [Chloroflexota bacterium]